MAEVAYKSDIDALWLKSKMELTHALAISGANLKLTRQHYVDDGQGGLTPSGSAIELSSITKSGFQSWLELGSMAYKNSLALSDIPGKGAANGLATLDANTKIPLSQLPDVILGQLLYGGVVDGSGVVTLSQNAKDKWGITSLTLTSTNYSDYEGAFFIASANGSSGVPSSLGVLTGDWVIATAAGWRKIDNTDAVTGVKGNAESSYRIGNVNITPANIGLGNVENTALSTWAGTNKITTLGTITTGVWHGSAIADTYIASASAWNAKYDKPSGGIPKTDLASAVQTSLGKADTALQSVRTLTIQKNGSTVGTFDPAASSNKTINIDDVASATALSNLKAGLTSKGAHDLPVYLNANSQAVAIDALSVPGNIQSTGGGVAAGGIASLAMNGGGGAGTITQIQINGVVQPETDGVVNLPAYPTWSTLSGKPVLATVATSGSYNDLTDKLTNATASTAGLMSTAHYSKLESIALVLGANGSWSMAVGSNTVTQSRIGAAYINNLS